MVDHVSTEQRSRIMSSVRSQDTQPEILIRSAIHRLGFRFRLHVKALPGTPDIVLPKHKKIIFVNGCLWHGHPNCGRAQLPQSNGKFWSEKISRNKLRDRKSIKALRKLGWGVMLIWQCQLRSKSGFHKVEKRLETFLRA
jgi:DNA mismatch endonuclease (patch repair protein)